LNDNSSTAALADIRLEQLQLTAQLCDALAVYDKHQSLVYWSDSVVRLYPAMAHRLYTGIGYGDVLALMHETRAIKNLPQAGESDYNPLDSTSNTPVDSNEYVHRLADDEVIRYERFRHAGLTIFRGTLITEQFRLRQALAGGGQKFLSFAELSSDWFWELDENLCYIYHSSHKQPLAGRSPQSVVGKPRIESLSGRIVSNDELQRHNECLRDQQPVDVVLSWRIDGREVHSKVRARPMYDHSGIFTGYIGCGHDVTTEYDLKLKLAHQANHDDLTGLLNRRAFDRTLSEKMQLRSEDWLLVVVNIDQFKLVNDAVGNEAGDQLLRQLADLIVHHAPTDSVVARLGSDEFALISPIALQDALNFSTHLIDEIGAVEFVWQQRKHSVGASIGIAELDNTVSDSAALLARANIACHSGKISGGNLAQIYSEDNSFLTLQARENQILRQIKFALNNDELHLYLQPIDATNPDTDSGYRKFEVLVRLFDEKGELLPPATFIPVAEKFDMMSIIDQRIVESALSHLRRLHATGIACAFSINLSGNTLSNEAALLDIRQQVAAAALPAGALCFEITETAAVGDISKLSEFMRQLRTFGCEFSLDDFGTGLSSLAYLRDLPVDYLKIDGTFIRHLESDQVNVAIVSSFVTLCRSMNIRTVAEFVETAECATLLQSLGIDYLQGYWLGKPALIDEYLKLLTDSHQAKQA